MFLVEILIMRMYMLTKLIKLFILICVLIPAMSFTLFPQSANINTKEFERVLSGLNFPEGPAWDGKGSLYVSNSHADYITRICNGKDSVFLKASENPFTMNKTNGLTFYKDGSLFACESGLGKILKILPDGKTEIYASGYNGKKFNRPNDLAFDKQGNLYFTDPNAYDTAKLDGVVYRIDSATKEVTPAAENLAFPNGIAFSSDAKHVFVCESAFNRVSKFRVDSTGKFTNQETFIYLPGGDPDGIGLDVAGNLYIAHFGGGRLFVVSPEGKITKVYTAPGIKPSNIEFAGEDMKTLYLTEDETNAVYRIKVDIPGLKLFCSPK